MEAFFWVVLQKKRRRRGGDDPLKNVCTNAKNSRRRRHPTEKKKGVLHSFVSHSRAFWGHYSNGYHHRRRTREGRKRERNVGKKHSEGRAKRTGERAVLDEGGERKGKANFNHHQNHRFFVSSRLVLLYPRAAARKWNARDSLCRPRVLLLCVCFPPFAGV